MQIPGDGKSINYMRYDWKYKVANKWKIVCKRLEIIERNKDGPILSPAIV